jgi:hypothetical protein
LPLLLFASKKGRIPALDVGQTGQRRVGNVLGEWGESVRNVPSTTRAGDPVTIGASLRLIPSRPNPREQVLRSASIAGTAVAFRPH